jgi:hypothetical protein
MDDPSVGDPLRELAAQLDITPSPEFSARVRARVEAGPGRAWRWHPWVIGSVATGMAIIVVSGLSVFRASSKPTTSIATVRQAEPPSLPVPMGRVSPMTSAEDQPVPSAVRRVADSDYDSTPAVVRHGNVLVPPDQAVALRTLLVGIRSGRVNVPRETRAPVDADGLLLAPDPIRIPLIHIEPIPALFDDDSQER